MRLQEALRALRSNPMRFDVIEARVRRGAAHLDEHIPGWLYEIDPDKLDVSDADVCMIGQLVCNYTRFIELGLMRPEEGIDRGFHEDAHASFDELTTLWRMLILERRLALAPAPQVLAA